MTGIGDMKSLLEIAKSVSSYIKGDKVDSLYIECMNGIGKYVTTVNVGNDFSKWVRKMGKKTLELPHEQVYDVRLYGLRPLPQRIYEATSLVGDKVIVDLTTATDFDMFRMEISYRMDEGILAGLVHHRSSPEPLAEEMAYHLSAQLVDPEALHLGFNEVEIEEFPVTAKVNIQQDIDTAFPSLRLFRRIQEIQNEIDRDTDPRHGIRVMGLQREKHRISQRLTRENPQKALRELLTLLRPGRFITYLRTDERDFHLHQCQWCPNEMFELLESISLPKAIQVTTRTDLSVKKPGSNGRLLYQSSRLTKDIAKITDH